MRTRENERENKREQDLETPVGDDLTLVGGVALAKIGLPVSTGSAVILIDLQVHTSHQLYDSAIIASARSLSHSQHPNATPLV